MMCVMQHYQEKLEQYEKEEQFLLDRIAQCSQLLDSSNRLVALPGEAGAVRVGGAVPAGQDCSVRLL